MRYPAEFGKYLLLDRINVGGMAEVFVAKTFGVEGFERLVALKCLLPRHCEDHRFLEMFIDEAHIAASLTHPNIVPVYELGEVEGQYYIAMEYVLGKDVRQILNTVRQDQRILPLSASIHIVARVCDGLDYAHRRTAPDGRLMNLVHRDVNPQNVLCSYDGEVKLTDFGIAKAERRVSQTEAGVLKGKFGYMSPEQIVGEPLDRRSDIFAAGILLYELATGCAAFGSDTDYETLERARRAHLRPPRDLNPKIPQELADVITRALAQTPADRYQYASEMSEALQTILLTRKRLYDPKRLASLLRELFREDIVDDRVRYDEFMAVRPPTQAAQQPDPTLRPSPGQAPGHTASAVEQAAKEALADLFTALPSAGEATGTLPGMSILPVRVYRDALPTLDATTTAIGETSVQLVSAADLELGATVRLWIQVPHLLAGLNVQGRVSSVVPAGGQNGIGIEPVFESSTEREQYLEAVRNLLSDDG